MPIVDGGAVRPRRGVYAAVAEAIDEEFRKLAVLGREPEAVWPRWRAMMAYGATVEVPAFWCRGRCGRGWRLGVRCWWLACRPTTRSASASRQSPRLQSVSGCEPACLLLCSFNRGRSVMAAAMFKHELRQRGLGDVVRVSSAGTCITCADHGPADERAFWVLHRHGYRVPLGHRTQLLNADRLNADLVVAFGAEHVDLLRKWGVDDDRIRCLHAKNPHTLRQFEDAYGRIEAAMPALLAWVEQRRPVWWRWWKLTPDGVLASPIGGYRWETADYKAFCPHPIKGSCSCGVYAFTSAADCHAHIDATGRFAPDLLARLSAPAWCSGGCS